MIESKLWNLVKGKPLSLSCIIASFYILFSHKSIESYRYNTFTRIAVRFAERMKLFNVCSSQSSLFFQLSQCTFFARLIHFNKAARESPLAFIWVYASLYEQNL